MPSAGRQQLVAVAAECFPANQQVSPAPQGTYVRASAPVANSPTVPQMRIFQLRRAAASDQPARLAERRHTDSSIGRVPHAALATISDPPPSSTRKGSAEPKAMETKKAWMNMTPRDAEPMCNRALRADVREVTVGCRGGRVRRLELRSRRHREPGLRLVASVHHVERNDGRR